MKLVKILMIVSLILSLGLIFSVQTIIAAEKSSSKPDDLKKEITEDLPQIEIRRLEKDEPLFSIELRNAEVSDFFRLIAHDYDFNILLDDKVSGKITASFTNISLEEALDNLAEMHGLLIEKKGSVISIKPNLVAKPIFFNHVQAEIFFEEISSADMELLSDLGKVMLGKQRNMVMIIDYPENVKKVETFAKALDGRMARKVFKLKYISSKALATEGETKEDIGEYELGEITTPGN
jgi:type II secretory pathway component GspD/PulD (secretin)